jgi:hypothetical protein
MERLPKLIASSIAQVFFDWLGFQFLDEARALLLQPTTAAPVWAYVGLVAFFAAAILACYVFIQLHAWFTARRQSAKAQGSAQQGQLVIPFKLQVGTTTATISVSDKPLPTAKAEPKIPALSVERADEDSDMFKQFEIALKERRQPVKARFEFVTIQNLTGPTIDGIEAQFHIMNAISRKVLHDSGPFVFIFSIHSDHLTLHREDMTLAAFKKHYYADNRSRLAQEVEAQVANTNDGKLASRSIVLHEGRPKTVGLAMAFEGCDLVFLPNYSTRSRVVMPCSFDIYLTFYGNPALSREPIKFHVEAKNWERLRITPLVARTG